MQKKTHPRGLNSACLEVKTKSEGTCIFVFISTFASCYFKILSVFNKYLQSEESIENIQYKK